ncbi:MAG: hypothetical protein ACP5VF_03855 [Acidobacteriota bacterium]
MNRALRALRARWPLREGLWPGWLVQPWLGLQAKGSDTAPEGLGESPVLEASDSP